MTYRCEIITYDTEVIKIGKLSYYYDLITNSPSINIVADYYLVELKFFKCRKKFQILLRGFNEIPPRQMVLDFSHSKSLKVSNQIQGSVQFHIEKSVYKN